MEDEKQVYSTDFKTPIIIGVCIWFFLMIGSFGFTWVKGKDLLVEWQKNKDLVALLTLGIVGITMLLPALSWQAVEIIEWQNKLTFRNVWDWLLSRTKEFKLNEVASVET